MRTQLYFAHSSISHTALFRTQPDSHTALFRTQPYSHTTLFAHLTKTFRKHFFFNKNHIFIKCILCEGTDLLKTSQLTNAYISTKHLLKPFTTFLVKPQIIKISNTGEGKPSSNSCIQSQPLNVLRFKAFQN